MYNRYNMTFVFETLSNKETQTEDALVKTTDQKHQSAKQRKKQDKPTSRKHFMICHTCFWCASYIDILDNMDALTYKVCPTCNHYQMVNIIVLNMPQPEELFYNLYEKSHQ